MSSDSSDPRVAYFTAGTVGAGHAMRGEAIRRGLVRAGFTGRFRTFGPATSLALGPTDQREAVAIKGVEALADPARAADSELGRRLLAWAPTLLVVDMFWAPVRHLLPSLPCPKWLLVRACPAVWLHGRGDTRFDAHAWDRIIEIEPLDLPQATHRLDPIVVANRDECRPPQALRERLGVATGTELTVICHAGKPGEMEILRRRAAAQADPRGHVASLDLHGQGLFPAAHWVGAADRIVSGAGYNCFWEAQWLGWDARTTFVPLPRSIDRQQLRVDLFRGHRAPSNGADALAAWIQAGSADSDLSSSEG